MGGSSLLWVLAAGHQFLSFINDYHCFDRYQISVNNHFDAFFLSNSTDFISMNKYSSASQ